MSILYINITINWTHCLNEPTVWFDSHIMTTANSHQSEHGSEEEAYSLFSSHTTCTVSRDCKPIYCTVSNKHIFNGKSNLTEQMCGGSRHEAVNMNIPN